MDFFWDRWEQTEDHSVDCPDKALVGAINKALDVRRAEEVFTGLWQCWWKKFPSSCVLATMTQNHFNGNRQQLRFWFGEPNYFGSNHVDSLGHHLIVTVGGEVGKLRDLVNKILPTEQFEEGVVEPEDKNNHTMPSQIVVWRRKA
ncbi:MAG: hypothetical protein NT041_00400 [Candidatus Vogelbacteria bacterium]|nr:hypothetical protein [Candidatus Vogelbacteria bacterium]